MTTTSSPFIIGLIIILMIIHTIAVTLYLRNKRLTPSSVLVAPLSACIMPMLFVLFVIGPINQSVKRIMITVNQKLFLQQNQMPI